MDQNEKTLVYRPTYRIDEKQKPSNASTELKIEIHSRNAYGLLLGKSAKRGISTYIPGLFDFSNSIKKIQQDLYIDNPYADWTLILIEEAIEKAETLIKSELAIAKERIESNKEDGILINQLTSAKPTIVDIKFHNQYSLRAAMLIKGYDSILRYFLPLKQLGIVDNEEFTIFCKKIMKSISNVFFIAIKYKSLDVTREQYLMQADSPEIVELKVKYGKIPEEIALGRKIPRYTHFHHRFQMIDKPNKNPI